MNSYIGEKPCKAKSADITRICTHRTAMAPPYVDPGEWPLDATQQTCLEACANARSAADVSVIRLLREGLAQSFRGAVIEILNSSEETTTLSISD